MNGVWFALGTVFGSVITFCACFYVWFTRSIAESEGRDE